MAATSPLTDSSPSPFGLVVDPPEKKVAAASDGASPDAVKRVRAGTGKDGAAARETAPAQGGMPKFPEMQPLPPPPKREDTKPIEAWGSLAMLAAALGGMASRTHATTALSAAGAALQGLHQRDEEKFKDEMERWKIATDNQQRMQTYEIETYKAIMGQRAQTFNDFIKLSREQQQETSVQLHAQALAQGNERIAALLEHQQFEEAYKTLEAQRKANESLQKERDKIESAYTMESAWAKAVTAGDAEAKDDPNGWKWKRFPEAAEKSKLPKPAPKPENEPGGDGNEGYVDKIKKLFGGGAAAEPVVPAPTSAPRPSVAASQDFTSAGKHYHYKGTGDYDDPKNWDITSVQ